MYNDDFNPPKVQGIDDETGEPLSKRPDDTPEVFSKRLRSYYQATAPLLEVSNRACLARSATRPFSVHRPFCSARLWRIPHVSLLHSPRSITIRTGCSSHQYYADEYPNALHSLTGSSSDELWPLLQAVVEPSLPDRSGEYGENDLRHVLDEADDMRDTTEVHLGDKTAHIK